MKIAIFGATGQTGRHLARLALEGGHEVTALLRDPSRLVTAEQIRVVFGTADDAVAIADVLAGADCAVSALSSGSGTLAGFARTAIPIMEKS